MWSSGTWEPCSGWRSGMLVLGALRDAAAVEWPRPLMAIARPGWAAARCSAQPRQPIMSPQGVRSLSGPSDADFSEGQLRQPHRVKPLLQRNNHGYGRGGGR